MNKYKVSGYTTVYFTCEVIAEDENDARSKVEDNLTMEEYINGDWGIESNDYDGYIDEIETNGEDEIQTEDDVELLEEDVEDPMGEEDEEDEEDESEDEEYDDEV